MVNSLLPKDLCNNTKAQSKLGEARVIILSIRVSQLESPNYFMGGGPLLKMQFPLDCGDKATA